MRYCASGWFYYRNILRCTVLQTLHLQTCRTYKQYIIIWVNVDNHPGRWQNNNASDMLQSVAWFEFSLKPDYPDWGFSVFFLVPVDKCRHSNYNLVTTTLYTSFTINFQFIILWFIVGNSTAFVSGKVSIINLQTQ